MSENTDFVWRMTMPDNGGPLELEAGNVLKDMDPKEYIVAIAEALITIGTKFLLSTIEGNVHDVSKQQDPEVDLTLDNNEYTFE